MCIRDSKGVALDRTELRADLLDNLTGVTFKTQEPSFVAGYIAAMTLSLIHIFHLCGKHQARSSHRPHPAIHRRRARGPCLGSGQPSHQQRPSRDHALRV